MKLVCLLVVLGLASSAYAGCCRGKTARLVQHQWDSIWTAEKSHNKVTIARAIFDDLFAAHPDAKALFKRVNVDDMDSPEFKAHCIRVMHGLDISINLVHDPQALKAELAHLSMQHGKREGVNSAQFDYIQTSFDNVLKHVIPDFNQDAWDSCFNEIKHGITYGLP